MAPAMSGKKHNLVPEKTTPNFKQMSNKGKKTIDELRKNNPTFDKKDMANIKGGKRSSWWLRRICGDITPQ
ncbi:hypothetical protein CEQ90_07680 [Lewinellaceae bacterium SD302]|nr:hypothetical protein CEQ90_07680 [Lewinellaceae bacterium SD302]